MKKAKEVLEVTPIKCENCDSKSNLNMVDDICFTILCDKCLELPLNEVGYEED